MRIWILGAALLLAGCNSRFAGAPPIETLETNRSPVVVVECLRAAFAGRPEGPVVTSNPLGTGFEVRADLPNVTLLDAIVSPTDSGARIELFGYWGILRQWRSDIMPCLEPVTGAPT